MAWMVATALSAGKAAGVELPTMREVEDLMHMLRNYGLKPFAPASTGGWMGDVAVLNAETMPAADRYRTYLAVALGQVKVVIGTRAVMYAPVEGPALFAILEDAAYRQNLVDQNYRIAARYFSYAELRRTLRSVIGNMANQYGL